MKIGMHIASLMETYNANLNEYMELVGALGYQVVEVPLLKPEGIDEDRVKKLLIETGMEICCGTGLALETDITSDDKKIRQNGLEYLKKSIDVTASLGARLLGGVIYEPWCVPARNISINAKEYLIEVYKELAEYSKKKNITLALEVINRYEGRMINTVHQAIEIVDAIGMDNVGIHLDTYHMNIEENNIYQAILDSKGYLMHFHASGNNRCAPGSGHLDWDSIFESLHKIEYKGYVNVECFVKAKNEVADSVFLWRDFDNPKRNAIKSLKFLSEKEKG